MAGGKFIIPVLVLIFGADIKTAGTASILISTRSKTLLSRLAIPVSAGSIVGALAGGYAAQWVSGDSNHSHRFVNKAPSITLRSH